MFVVQLAAECYEKQRMIKAIKNNYGMEIDDRDYDIHVANKKSLSLFFIGLLFIILSFAFGTQIPSFIAELINIVGWVALWEMCENLLLNNAAKRTERIYKLQLYDSEVKFVFDNEEIQEDKK